MIETTQAPPEDVTADELHEAVEHLKRTVRTLAAQVRGEAQHEADALAA